MCIGTEALVSLNHSEGFTGCRASRTRSRLPSLALTNSVSQDSVSSKPISFSFCRVSSYSGGNSEEAVGYMNKTAENKGQCNYHGNNNKQVAAITSELHAGYASFTHMTHLH